MKTLRNSMRRGMLRSLLVLPMLALAPACTDLTEVPDSALTPENAFRTEAEILAGVASVYAGLRGTMWGYYNLSEITTDEMIVPTRGSDWFDNGRWLEIHRQAWTANSGSALDDMNGTWNDLYSGVARSNLMIDVLTKQADSPLKTASLAELRVLRSWYYYMLMDMWGGVPLVTSTEVARRPRQTSDSIFKFIESELKAARVDLPRTWPAAQYGRVTRGAADAILASLYLNARQFTGTVTAAGLQPGAARWQDAINHADSVINSGTYSLETNWKNNFSGTNETSKENVFVIAHANIAGLGNSLPMRTLHYNSVTTAGGGPWNGFAALADTYRAFDPADARRDIFLVGLQRSFDTGLPIKDRAGADLNFTIDIGNATAAGENEGARYNKFPPLSGAAAGDAHPNDYPFFRLAEMYLIKAEAQNELGQTGAAVTLVNMVRARQFATPRPITAANQVDVRAAIVAERLFEFTAEGKRRRDLIRAGRFTEARTFKTATEPFKILMPIPSVQLQTNPLLVQNAGY